MQESHTSLQLPDARELFALQYSEHLKRFIEKYQSPPIGSSTMIRFTEEEFVKLRLAGGRVPLDQSLHAYAGSTFHLSFNLGTWSFRAEFTIPRTGTVVAVDFDGEQNITNLIYADD